MPQLPLLPAALLTAVVLASPLGAMAQVVVSPEASVRPGINAAFLDPELKVDEWVDRFEVESREIYTSRHEIVRALKLQPGDRVADVGTGTGLFVAPLAEAVSPRGWVFAADIAPAFVNRVGQLAQAKRLRNVTPVLCGEDHVRLPPASIDLAFLCDVYHHFEYPFSSLQSIFDALVPGGELVVVDFERIPGKSRDWVLGHLRAGKEVFRKEIEVAGFEFVEETPMEGFTENYFLRFRRPDTP
jgi:ubiquinone/menaquinone biosynthesis C-methylase UbiE